MNQSGRLALITGVIFRVQDSFYMMYDVLVFALFADKKPRNKPLRHLCSNMDNRYAIASLFTRKFMH